MSPRPTEASSRSSRARRAVSAPLVLALAACAGSSAPPAQPTKAEASSATPDAGAVASERTGPEPAAPDLLPEQLAAVTKPLARALEQLDHKVRLAVLPFTDDLGHANGLGRYAAERVLTDLGRGEHFELVERARLDQVMKELKLDSSELVGDESAASLGNLLGADGLLIGTFTDLGKTIDLNCRVVEPESGLVLATASGQLARTPAVDKLWPPPTQDGQTHVGAGGTGGAEKPAAPRPLVVPMEPNIARPGHEYRHFELAEGKARACQRACAEDDHCRAFTYVKPASAGRSAVCILRDAVAAPVAKARQISGVRTEALAALPKGGLPADSVQLFVRPTAADGQPVALCLTAKKGCGEPAATAWCNAQGLGRAVHYTAQPASGDAAAVHAGDGSACKKRCDAFSTIICAKDAAARRAN